MQSTWMLLLYAVLSINISYDWVTHIHLNENALRRLKVDLLPLTTVSGLPQQLAWP